MTHDARDARGAQRSHGSRERSGLPTSTPGRSGGPGTIARGFAGALREMGMAGRGSSAVGARGSSTTAGAGLRVLVWRIGAGGWCWGALAALAGGAAVGAGVTAFRVAERDLPIVVDAAAHRERGDVELTVTDDPRRVDDGVGPATLLVPADLTHARLTGGAVRLRVAVVVFAQHPAWRDLLPGQRIRAGPVRFDRARGGDLTAATLTTDAAPERLGAAPFVQRAAGRLREGLRAACAPLPDDQGGLLPGLVLGDTSRLPPAVAADFRSTGMTHLVAVSGSNVMIILGAVLLAARWGRAGPRVCALVCLVALVGFVILVRPSPSVLRAGLMGAIGLLALAVGRRRVAVPALAATVIALVVADPALAVRAGFILSVVATAALILLAPGWRDALRRRGVPAGMAEALAIPAAAQLACGPVIAALAGTVNPVAVVANLLAAPAVAPATVIGVVAALVGPLAAPVAGLLVWVAQWPAWWLVTVARVGADLPGAVLPWPAGAPGAVLLALLTGALLIAGRYAAVRRVVAVVTAAGVLGAVPVRLVVSGWPPPGWLVVACDVGQGDALVLPVGRRDAIVVDTGPEPAAVDRCLRALGVRRVRLLVLSHFHVDHVGGVAGVTRGRVLEEVVAPPPAEPAAGRRFAAAALPVAVGAAPAGWSRRIGEVGMVALGPAAPLRGTRSDANNNSLILAATVRGVSILLTGDAEEERQRDLLAGTPPALLRARILKVAHHGSAYQDPAFLDAVRPTVALIPVGSGNRYGHPHPSIPARLRRAGAAIARTDVDGDVAVTSRSGVVGIAFRGRAPPTR
ncbi:ComEC/Rec2 family competence protein [Pilimelia anulata]